MHQLEKYVRKRFGNILPLLAKPKNQWTPKTFHLLRVEIKKLNACAALIHFFTPSFKRKKTFRPLKSIFKAAGHIREIQVEETLLNKYPLNAMLPTYLRAIKEEKESAQNTYLSILKELSPELFNKTEKKLIQHVKDIKIETCQKYLNHQHARILHHLNKAESHTANFHKLRIIFKEFGYVLQMTQIEKNTSDISKYEALLALLGSWHDLHTGIIHLKTARAKGIFYHKETMQFNLITEQLTKEMNVLTNHIRQQISIVKGE